MNHNIAVTTAVKSLPVTLDGKKVGMAHDVMYIPEGERVPEAGLRFEPDDPSQWRGWDRRTFADVDELIRCLRYAVLEPVSR